MKKTYHILILLFSLNYNLHANNTVKAIGIFDKNGNGENIQHITITKNNYQGLCYSKIVVFGDILNSNIKVEIGNSIGHYVKSSPIYNKTKIKIAEEVTYKHYNITKGYFTIRLNHKIIDTKVYVK